MTLALWCVLAAALLPYAATGIAKFSTRERYDNRDPRAFLDRQTGLAKRADNAQKNSFEAFPFFAAAVLTAQLLKAPQGTVDLIAVLFIVLRGAYLACYLANWAAARSLVWLGGIACCVALFVVAA
jgi:uncharacterized MAPEG superfamily protein